MTKDQTFLVLHDYEIRSVPPDWQHPCTPQGDFIPLYDQDYVTAGVAWLATANDWEAGYYTDYDGQRVTLTSLWQKGYAPCRFIWDYTGVPNPDPVDYRPAWTEAEATHFQLYYSSGQSTPISPVYATRAEIVAWWVANGGQSEDLINA